MALTTSFHKISQLRRLDDLSTHKETKDDNFLGHMWTQNLGMGLEYSMITMCLARRFIWLKVSLTPSLSTSCSFRFPSRFLMPLAGFSIDAGVDNVGEGSEDDEFSKSIIPQVILMVLTFM